MGNQEPSPPWWEGGAGALHSAGEGGTWWSKVSRGGCSRVSRCGRGAAVCRDSEAGASSVTPQLRGHVCARALASSLSCLCALVGLSTPSLHKDLRLWVPWQEPAHLELETSDAHATRVQGWRGAGLLCQHFSQEDVDTGAAWWPPQALCRVRAPIGC